MAQKYTRVSGILLILALIIALATIGISAYIAQNENTELDMKENITEITEAEADGAALALPDTVAMSAGQTKVFTFTLPDTIGPDYGLMYSSNYCTTVVTINGEKIGSYGETMPLPYGNMIGNIRVVIPIDAGYAGCGVTITVKAHYSGVTPLGNVYVGDMANLRNLILEKNMVRVVSLVFFLTIMVLSIGISVYQAYQRRMQTARTYLALAGFILSISAWLVCSSDLPQFLTNQNEIVSLTSFLSLSFMGPTFMFFCALSLTRGRRMCAVTGDIGLILPVLNCVCFVLKIADPVNLMYATHVYLAACIIMAIVNGIRSWKQKDETRYLIVGIACVGVGALIAIIVFYNDQMGQAAGNVLNATIGIFVFFMFAMLLNKEQRIIEEQTSDDVYRKMAFMDYLTGCGNRAAYEREIEEQLAQPHKDVTLVMFDLNRLKITNDQLGHAAGDELILGAAECIAKAFTPAGRCYRLGGDEFATILWDSKDELNRYFEKFENQLHFYNSEHVLPVSISYGHATEEDIKDKKNFDALYTRADQEMYREKVRFHEETEE